MFKKTRKTRDIVGALRVHARCVLWSLGFVPILAGAQDAGPERTFRLQLANDVVFQSDNLFTDGFDLQWHGRGVTSWDAADNALARAGAWWPGLQGDGLVHRHALTLGQHTQTPQDERVTTLIRDDVPYAGALVLINSWSVYDDRRFRGAELLVGVVGPASGAGWVHEEGHRLIDNRVARGWDNQLSNRALVGVSYNVKQKVARGAVGGLAYDASVEGQGTLGNMYTLAGARVSLRLGRNLPGGFAYTPGKLGLQVVHDARLPPPAPAASSLFLSLTLGGERVLRNVFIDDNELRDQLKVRKQPWVGRLAGAIHWARGPYAVRFTLVATTDEVKASTTANSDNNDRYGVLTLEYRY